MIAGAETVDAVNLDVETLAFAVGVIIPALVALVVKARASSAVKAAANAILTATAAAIVSLIAADGEVTIELGRSIAFAWVASIASYYGLLKPLGVAGAIANAVPGGIGSAAVTSPAVPPTPPPASTPPASSERIGGP